MSRPFSLKLLIAVALGLAAFNLLGFYTGLTGFAYASQLPLSVPPGYLLADHAAWAGVWAAVAVGLWGTWRWAPRAMLAAAVLYVAHGWLNRWLWSRSDYVAITGGWTLAGDLLGLAVVGWLVWRAQRALRRGL